MEEVGAMGKNMQRKERLEISPLAQSWYKHKQQHLSKNQKVILRELWPQYGITLRHGCILIRSIVFPDIKEHDQLILDIGFGNGDSSIGMASLPSDDHNKCYIIGCEIHKAGLANALSKLQASSIENVKVIRSEVFSLLSIYMQPNMLDKVCIFFPDPWPNAARDGRRRVVRIETLVYLAALLRAGGQLHIATDAEDYYQYCLNCIDEFNSMQHCSKSWILLQDVSRHSVEQDRSQCSRPVTHYERKAYDEGRVVHDLVYSLQAR